MVNPVVLKELNAVYKVKVRYSVLFLFFQFVFPTFVGIRGPKGFPGPKVGTLPLKFCFGWAMEGGRGEWG